MPKRLEINHQKNLMNMHIPYLIMYRRGISPLMMTALKILIMKEEESIIHRWKMAG